MICQREAGNSHDPFAISLIKPSTGTVGMFPGRFNLSVHCFFVVEDSFPEDLGSTLVRRDGSTMHSEGYRELLKLAGQDMEIPQVSGGNCSSEEKSTNEDKNSDREEEGDACEKEAEGNEEKTIK